MASSYPAYGAPPQAQYPPSTNYGNSSNTFNKGPQDVQRGVSRTPSPTPSEEAELLRDGLMDWKALSNWRFWVRREWLWYYIIGGIILILTTLIAIYDKQIVKWLTPATTWMKNLKFGWLIPIAIFFVISFPPLFGHEIVAILCGVVWGLGVGFAIVAVGTFLGELGNFYAFKYCCRARGEKLEKENLNYACLAKVVRDGGFIVALVCRLSVLPGHFTTAIFSTCGMGVITFSIACILSMPKQFITVYIGVILEETGNGTETTKDKIISDSVLGVTILVTAGAMWFITRRMRLAKPDVIYARRKARQGKLERADFMPYNAPNESSNSVFNPNGSDTNIPLTSDLPYDNEHQQWDKNGHAMGYTGDPRLYAPEPQRAQTRPPIFQTEASGSYNAGGQPYGGIGTTYPQGPAEAGGRSPLRQESGDVVEWETQHRAGTRDTFDLPRVPSPGLHEPFNNPFEPTPATAHQETYIAPLGPPPSAAPATAPGYPTAPSHPAQAQTQTQTQTPTAQFANYYPPPAAYANVTSPPLPNPFTGATPAQFTHPQPYGHAPEATDASFFTADGHSRTGTEEPLHPGPGQSPPPPSYQTAPPR